MMKEENLYPATKLTAQQMLFHPHRLLQDLQGMAMPEYLYRKQKNSALRQLVEFWSFLPNNFSHR